MTRPLEIVTPLPTDAVADVRQAHERLRRAWAAEPSPTAAVRRDRLDRLVKLIQRHRDELCDAISRDFGGRARLESLMADVFTTIEEVRHARRHLGRWMRPRRVSPSWLFLPSRARIQYQPLGVVGIISPWNYPVNLALAPLAAALAAGNRVLLKPSELTPATSSLLQVLLGEAFTADEVAVVTGGPEVARAVTELPLDHLLFTGSTAVGRLVAKAAAENLVPVTLELGGKSPAIIHRDFDLARAADRIASAKLFNAGQTCIAPDYVLLPEGLERAFADAFRTAVAARYANFAGDDYTSVINDRAFDRLKQLLTEAEADGARAEPVGEGEASGRRLPPTLVWNTTDEMRLMQEEIFGPLLPVRTYRSLDEALAYVNDRPRPLALYYFDDDAARADDVLARTVSGGACVNDAMMHFAQGELPFGGVGASGMGAYHGFTGFETFSHRKAVFVASRLSPAGRLMHPARAALLERALGLLVGGKPRPPGAA